MSLRARPRSLRLLLVAALLSLTVSGCWAGPEGNRIIASAPADRPPMDAIIDHVFGAAAPQAIEIARCESTMNPWAVSPTNDHGLFQINRRWHQSSFSAVTGQPWDAVYDAYWNAVYAKHLYDNQGWGPWTCRYVL